MAGPLSFRWHEAFIARIDEARGDMPRSRFVREAVEEKLASGRSAGVAAPAPAPAPAVRSKVEAPAPVPVPKVAEAGSPQVRLEVVVARLLGAGAGQVPPVDLARARRMVQTGKVRVRGIAGPKGDAKDGGECRNPVQLVNPEAVEIA